jgi:hypothetical protein
MQYATENRFRKSGEAVLVVARRHTKLQHWRAFQTVLPPGGAPVLEFGVGWSRLATTNSGDGAPKNSSFPRRRESSGVRNSSRGSPFAATTDILARGASKSPQFLTAV